jgi:hypothetical protein
MKRTSKTIFKVTCDTDSINEAVDKKDYRVTVSKGTSGEEMTYALVALVQVILAHEEGRDNQFSANAFFNYLKMIIDDSKIGVPEKDD